MGLSYAPVKQVKTRLGAAMKETFTNEHYAIYTDDLETEEIEKSKLEIGVESVTNLETKINDIILYKSDLSLFSNLSAFDEIDVKWDNFFSASIAKYIDVNFNIRIHYDKDISSKRQIKQSLALGLKYIFI